jgi:hypothetical protein
MDRWTDVQTDKQTEAIFSSEQKTLINYLLLNVKGQGFPTWVVEMFPL